MSAHWIAVAAAEHVARGRDGGFMQVCHGKAAPLRRIQPGDGVVYYSPTQSFGGKDRLQAFTAIGIVGAGVPYQADMGNGFCPMRRDVAWARADAAPIRPLLERLACTAGKSHWGAAFRFGLLAVGAADFAVIARAMRADL